MQRCDVTFTSDAMLEQIIVNLLPFLKEIRSRFVIGLMPMLLPFTPTFYSPLVYCSVLRAVYSASHKTIFELLACVLQVTVAIMVLIIVMVMVTNITHITLNVMFTYRMALCARVLLTNVPIRLPLDSFLRTTRRFWASRNLEYYHFV